MRKIFLIDTGPVVAMLNMVSIENLMNKYIDTPMSFADAITNIKIEIIRTCLLR